MAIVQTNRVFAFLLVALGEVLGAPADAQVSEQFVQAYLWPTTTAGFRQAEAALVAHPSLVGVTRMQNARSRRIDALGPSGKLRVGSRQDR